jgi:hypothetical protein
VAEGGSVSDYAESDELIVAGGALGLGIIRDSA